MNDNRRQVRPVFRGPRPNHSPRPRNGNVSSPRAHHNIVRPRPPSFSRAPWDVTQWVDPIEARNPKSPK